MLRSVLRAAHRAAATTVLQPAYNAYRFVSPSKRRAVAEYRGGLRMRAKVEQLTLDQRREWLIRRLRLVVRRSAMESSYYRSLFARVGFDPESEFGFEEYARLPVLDREQVARAGQNLVSRAIPPALLRRDATGGSDGAPTEIWTGPEERGWRESGIEYYMRRLGVPAGSRVALLWGHHLDPLARDGVREQIQDWVGNLRWFDCLRLSPEVLASYHATMQRWRPECIVAYASALAALADTVRLSGATPSYPTRCCVTGAEKLLPAQRASIEEVFRRPLYERYGSRDVGLVGAQVSGRGSLEIDWTCVMVEPETTEQMSSILVTKLRADGMPMLRYRIGDIARFPPGSVPGAPVFTLPEVIGRATDRIWLRDGSWVHGIGFPHLMKDMPVQRFQVHQSADLAVEVRVVPGVGFTEASRRRIEGIVRANLVGLDVEVTTVSEIAYTPSNKWRPVISDVTVAAAIEAA